MRFKTGDIIEGKVYGIAVAGHLVPRPDGLWYVCHDNPEANDGSKLDEMYGHEYALLLKEDTVDNNFWLACTKPRDGR